MNIKTNTRKKLYRFWLCILIALVSLVVLIPLYWIFICSAKPAGKLFTSPIDFFPQEVTINNYIRLMETMNVLEKAANTLIITGFALFFSTIICTLSAYAFSRYRTKGLSAAKGALLATALIPPIVTARPLYDFLRSTGLVDTYPGLIILYTSSLLPFSILILTNFFSEVPITIEEAAEVDGCNFIQKFFLVLLPLMRPGIATICIINFINCLNDLFTPLFFAGRIEVLSVAITMIPTRNAYSVPWDLTSAMGWIILFPIIIFVSVFQKQIMEGIMSGSVKG